MCIKNTLSSELRTLCRFMFFSLRVSTSSWVIIGSLSCSSHDHIRQERIRGSFSVHSLSHAPSREFSSVCKLQQRLTKSYPNLARIRDVSMNSECLRPASHECYVSEIVDYFCLHNLQKLYYSPCISI